MRCGGHNGGGLGSVDDGLVIDLSHDERVTVDPPARMVRVQGGATLGQVDTATHEHGGAVPVGVISTTGVGGLTLGGGIGHLTRAVRADDRQPRRGNRRSRRRVGRQTDAEREPDLFWAIRGGGGNFGVVTSFSFRCIRSSTCSPGRCSTASTTRPSSCAGIATSSAQQPDELGGFFAFLSVPPGPPFPEELHLRKVCGVVWCQNGEEETTGAPRGTCVRQAAPRRRRARAVPGAGTRRSTPCTRPGDQWYWRGEFVSEIPDAAIEEHVEFAAEMPTWKSTMHLYPIDGAASRVGERRRPPGHTATRGGRRSSRGVDPGPGERGESSATGRRRTPTRSAVRARGRVRRTSRWTRSRIACKACTARTTTGSRGSRRSTTRTTSSASTRTSSRR